MNGLNEAVLQSYVSALQADLLRRVLESLTPEELEGVKKQVLDKLAAEVAVEVRKWDYIVNVDDLRRTWAGQITARINQSVREAIESEVKAVKDRTLTEALPQLREHVEAEMREQIRRWLAAPLEVAAPHFSVRLSQGEKP